MPKRPADLYHVQTGTLRLSIAVAEDELRRSCCRRREFLQAHKDRCRKLLAELEGK